MPEKERACVSGEAEARALALIGSLKGRAAIQALANVLMERGEVSGDDAAVLFRSAYDGRECAFGAWNAIWPASPAQIRSGFISGDRTMAA